MKKKSFVILSFFIAVLLSSCNKKETPKVSPDPDGTPIRIDTVTEFGCPSATYIKTFEITNQEFNSDLFSVSKSSQWIYVDSVFNAGGSFNYLKYDTLSFKFYRKYITGTDTTRVLIPSISISLEDDYIYPLAFSKDDIKSMKYNIDLCHHYLISDFLKNNTDSSGRTTFIVGGDIATNVYYANPVQPICVPLGCYSNCIAYILDHSLYSSSNVLQSIVIQRGLGIIQMQQIDTHTNARVSKSLIKYTH